MNLEIQFATERKTCFRCTQLGLPPLGIAEGEDFCAITVPGREPESACMDCFDRLTAEVD